MELKNIVVPNKDFQTSINIEFDFGSRKKVEGLIPTDAVCRYLELLLSAVMTPSNQRAKLFVGAYGKGKSHVVLTALTSMWLKETEAFGKIIEAYRLRDNGFSDSLERFVTDGQRLLPVIISGSTADLRHSLLLALRNALKLCDSTDLMPTTNYDGAIKVLGRWRREYPETLERFEEFTGATAREFISRLKALDTAAYNEFCAVYPQLTSGGKFDALDSADVLAVYEHVLKGLATRGIDGIYVVYDEFSKYLETSIGRATVEDTRLLQDFAEACNRSGMTKQLHLLLISHKSISNYIDADLPKEKVDGWRGVSGRFQEVDMVDDEEQAYELISAAIVKDERLWHAWQTGHTSLIERIAKRYARQGLFATKSPKSIICGCFPLHPLTAFLLPKLSEKVAQNERTLFTFLSGAGDKTMSAALETAPGFVTPDYVYDYFEPLLRKEIYTSPLHGVYELAKAALAHAEHGSLEERIVKTIAVIDAVAQYDRVEPTKETLFDLFSDCGIPAEEVDEAITNLIEKDSVVYLKHSNAYLKLKKTTGVRIDVEVANRAEALRAEITCEQALNREIGAMALYPSRYNEDKGMVRFFNCGFIGASKLRAWCASNEHADRILKDAQWQADGEIVGIYCASPDEHMELKKLAKNVLSCEPLTVVVYPKKFIRIDSALYRLEAARQLKSEAGDDKALADEYEIIVEDYAEIVDEYIDGFFQPEMKRSLYYINGSQKKAITRKRRLSEELSVLCDDIFASTPRITSESLNKNDLTGTAFNSRTKILKALCMPTLAANLGFVGNGQETSMARSALEKTGLILDIKDAVDQPGEHEPGIDRVIDTIKDFVEHANDCGFDELYNQLTGRELGIGLRRGPIPIYLAYVLRDYREQVKVTRDDKEKTLGENLLDDISRNPGAYRITRLDWSPEMETYIANLAKIFGCKAKNPTRGDVAEAMRLWYVALPQMTRNAKTDYAHNGEDHVPERRLGLFKAIKRIDRNTDKLLFEDIPGVFGAKVGSSELLDALRAEKDACDSYLRACIEGLAKTLIAIFDPNAHEKASLSSVLRDWADAHPAAKTHVVSEPRSDCIAHRRLERCEVRRLPQGY